MNKIILLFSVILLCFFILPIASRADPVIEIMISEIYYNTPDDLQNEFIELYVWDDGGQDDIDLSGWYITDYDGNTETLPDIIGLEQYDYIAIYIGSGTNDLNASDGNATIYLNRISQMFDNGDEAGLYNAGDQLVDFVRYGGGNNDTVLGNWSVSDLGITADNIDESIQIHGQDMDNSSNWVSATPSSADPNHFEWIIDDNDQLLYQIHNGVNYPIILPFSPSEDPPPFDIQNESGPLNLTEIKILEEMLNYTYNYLRNNSFNKTPVAGADGDVDVRVSRGGVVGGNADAGTTIHIQITNFDSLAQRVTIKKSLEHEHTHLFQYSQSGNAWGPVSDWGDIEGQAEYWSHEIVMKEYNLTFEQVLTLIPSTANRLRQWLQNTDMPRNPFTDYVTANDPDGPSYAQAHYGANHWLYRYIAAIHGQEKVAHIHRVRNVSAGITGIKTINKAFEEQGKNITFEDIFRGYMKWLWDNYEVNITLTHNTTYNGGNLNLSGTLNPWGTDYKMIWVNTTDPFNITFNGQICRNYSITVIKIKGTTKETETYRFHSNGTIIISSGYDKIVLIESQLNGATSTPYVTEIQGPKTIPKNYAKVNGTSFYNSTDTFINMTGWCDNVSSTVYLYRNFTLLQSGTGIVTNITQASTLPVGNYTLQVNSTHNGTLATVEFSVVASTTTTTTTTSITTTISGEKGARTHDWMFQYYANIESLYTALMAGEIDLIGGSLGWSNGLFPSGLADTGGLLTSDEANYAFTIPDIVVAQVPAMNTYEFDLNNNWKIPSYPGFRSPTSYKEFRQALAFLTDKDYIVDTFCGGSAERIDQPVPASQKAWAHQSYWYPYYPYEYSPLMAKAVLDSQFYEGTTPNPYYDPTFPGSSQLIRTYPSDHEKAGQDLDPLIFVIRIDDFRMREAGRLLYNNMRKMGIPVNEIEGTISTVHGIVFGLHDYHIYTGSWTTPQYPVNVYFNYHSKYNYPYGPNYVTGTDNPELDELLENVYYSSSFSSTVNSFKEAMGLFTEECINIPLWSDRSYAAWNKNLLGVSNMRGYGPINPYTFMNAYKIDGSPIRIGTFEPKLMNMIWSTLMRDYINLDRMNLYGGLDIPPYNLAVLQPGFAQQQTVDTWIDPDDGQTKTKITRVLRSDGYFADPVTGDQTSQIDANNFFFSAWYQYAVNYGWNYPKWQDIHHIDIVGSDTVDIYYDTSSYWFPYAASGPIFSMDVWLQPPLSEYIIETFTEGMELTTPGFVNLAHDPVWIESVTANGIPLTMFTDYNIVNGKLYIFTHLPGSFVEVNYFYPGDSYGYTPGNMAWQDAFESPGILYTTSFDPGISMTLKKNPFYYMNTPLLGEVDFARKSNGCQRVDIFDIVFAAGAYGSQGTAIPSSNWFAGADLAPEVGKIDIFDIVTIAGHYGEEWDCPT